MRGRIFRVPIRGVPRPRGTPDEPRGFLGSQRGSGRVTRRSAKTPRIADSSNPMTARSWVSSNDMARVSRGVVTAASLPKVPNRWPNGTRRCGAGHQERQPFEPSVPRVVAAASYWPFGRPVPFGLSHSTSGRSDGNRPGTGGTPASTPVEWSGEQSRVRSRAASRVRAVTDDGSGGRSSVASSAASGVTSGG